MAISKLDTATAGLLKWYQLFSLEDMVVGGIAGLSTNEANAALNNIGDFLKNSSITEDNIKKSAIIKEISSAIIETQKGSVISSALLKKFIGITKEASGKRLDVPITSFFVGADENSDFNMDNNPGIVEILGISNDDGINQSVDKPTKASPTVSVHLVHSKRISLSNKNPNALSIFLNAIPSIEWSRAVPFIRIKFQFQRPALSSDGHVSTPSVLKFLDGSRNLSDTTGFDFKLQTGRSPEQEFEFSGDDGSPIGEAGSELFMMPQTLVNPDSDDGDSFRAAPVIDKFRPLASLKSFTVDVVPAAGIIAYRTAKLSFILHDRTRLNEMADFLKSGLYNHTEILIEYGWQHPDDDSPFGNFINALRTKDKYQIKNNHFKIKNNGEVDIDLDLFTKGALDLYTSKIADSPNIVEKGNIVLKLQEKIGDLSRQFFKAANQSNLIKEVRGQQIFSTASDHSSNLLLSKDLKRELAKTLSSLNKSPVSENAKELRKALVDLYGSKKKNEPGAAKNFGTSISEVINAKMKIITGKTKDSNRGTPDPFIDSFIKLVANAKEKGNIKNIIERGDDKRKFVSLAKLMLLFVVQPLVETNKFDDIQLIFHPFNDNAGPARELNIGNFPIDIGTFQKNYDRVAKLRRTANLSLREFLNFISNKYLEDISNPVYGLRDLYRYETNKETKEIQVLVNKSLANDITALSQRVENNMRAANVPDGNFKLPQVDIYIEAVSGVPSTEGQSEDAFEGLTILKIHVFDKHATAFAAQSDFLSAQRDDAIRTLGKAANSVVQGETTSTDLQVLVDNAGRDGANLIERIEDEDGESEVYSFIGGPKEVKNFISKTMPTMVFGASNTAVLDAGLETIQDQKLSTINMINSGDRGDLTPQGAATNGLPIRVFPAQLNMRSFGCPIMEFTQTLFCDFQTNTSIDNIYAATKIQHVLEPGKFVTSTTMTPLDAYGQYQNIASTIGAAITKLGGYIKITDE